MKKVILAYSGGLDTSVAVAWLREQFDVEVVTLTVDVGGGSLRQGVERLEVRPHEVGDEALARVDDVRPRCPGGHRPALDALAGAIRRRRRP